MVDRRIERMGNLSTVVELGVDDEDVLEDGEGGKEGETGGD
jgi:hypothetical protein